VRKSKDNPYNWDGESKHFVPRTNLLTRVREMLLNGDHGYILGCRGMGKSSFLRKLSQSLEQEPVETIYFPEPPAKRTIEEASKMLWYEVEKICKRLSVSSTCQSDLRTFAEQMRIDEFWFLFLEELEQKTPNLQSVILLLDELDGYAAPDGSRTPWGASFIDKLEGVRKRSQERLVIYAAGGLSTAALDSLYLSTFFSRATPELLEPFGFDELVELAAPFRTRGTPVSDEVIEMIRVTSGGNPALATFALENLWATSSPTPNDVAAVMEKQKGRPSSIPSSIRGAIFESSISDGPKLVWSELTRADGTVPKERIDAIVSKSTGHFQDKTEWIFRMLRTSGLIRADDLAFLRNPIQVELIPSIMTLDIDSDIGESLTLANTLREQLSTDLIDILKRIHRMSGDFFNGSNEIIPESVFSAMIGLLLEMRGWTIDREANSGPGRTDIKAHHSHFGDEAAIVEVKIWGRNDYESIHEQVTAYWTARVMALATVTVSKLQDEDWPDKYAAKCLDGKTPGYSKLAQPPALAGHFVAKAPPNCGVNEVDHFLLRLAKREKR
jgi:hypothetical protein